MNFNNTEVFNFEGALRGMRNPLESSKNADSRYCVPNECVACDYMCDFFDGWKPYHIGENDMGLAKRLVLAGSEHRKFLRQILVSVDITAPIYWWKEFDTYKVGTAANSTSTMHKLASNQITIDFFETDDMEPFEWPTMSDIIERCERLRVAYVTTKEIKYWKALIRILPESWLQTRTVTMNYENLRNMYAQRQNHKLTEWHSFCKWVDSLPYAKQLITIKEN